MNEAERGSVTLKLLVFSVAVFVMIGLVVDGAGKVRAGVEAQQLAASASRAAANSLSGDAVDRGGFTVDPGRAQQAVSSMLAVAGGTGSAAVSGNTVSVDVTIPYRTVFLKYIGFGALEGSGSASARLVSQ